MFIDARLHCFLVTALLCTTAASTEHHNPAAQPASQAIRLDVVVTAKSGPPVTDLQQQDFTLLDNDVPQAITSFAAVSGRQAPIEVVLVIDAVNTAYQTVAFERSQIDSFLHAEGGHLAHPLALAIFTDKGTEILGGEFSSDGNALSTTLDREDIGLRSIQRSAGYYGATERLQLSLRALDQLVASESGRPGRKVILWVSPGWPLLSGPNALLDSKQQQQIFGDIVNISTKMRAARVTLYSINPLGTGESLSQASYYKEFLKGVSKPGQVDVGNLGLQVLAIQSGGLALDLSNDLARSLQECLADAAPYYEISFNSAPAERPNEYHRLEIKLAKPGLTARTRQGYYAQPLPHD
jgi:VWFA-related protein